MPEYIGVIHKDASSDLGVSFPDFPGAVTAGVDLEDAKRMAAEALELHVRGMHEDGQAILAPSSLDEILADPENADATTIAVLIDIGKQARKSGADGGDRTRKTEVERF